MTIPLTEVSDVSALEQCIQSCKVSCSNCRLNSICLPQALESGEIEALALSSNTTRASRRIGIYTRKVRSFDPFMFSARES